MKILIIGANGTIGKKVSAEFSKRHEIVKAERESGDVKVDIESSKSIENMYQQAGKIDAVIVVAGESYFGDFQTMSEENVYVGIKSKLMGQVNVVLIGQKYINDGGSFTLTTGKLSNDPVKYSSATSLVDGALNSFTLGASRELKRSIRINAVSPELVEDSEKELGSYFPGHIPVDMKRVISAYVKSVEGCRTGEIIKVN
jgi:NAD(P)-dependent dehydrogenase (short-subunit alcohol dehydrogenase family)